MKNYVDCEIILTRNKVTSSIHQMELITKLLENSENKGYLYPGIFYKLSKEFFHFFILWRVGVGARDKLSITVGNPLGVKLKHWIGSGPVRSVVATTSVTMDRSVHCKRNPFVFTRNVQSWQVWLWSTSFNGYKLETLTSQINADKLLSWCFELKLI